MYHESYDAYVCNTPHVRMVHIQRCWVHILDNTTHQLTRSLRTDGAFICPGPQVKKPCPARIVLPKHPWRHSIDKNVFTAFSGHTTSTRRDAHRRCVGVTHETNEWFDGNAEQFVFWIIHTRIYVFKHRPHISFEVCQTPGVKFTVSVYQCSKVVCPLLGFCCVPRGGVGKVVVEKGEREEVVEKRWCWAFVGDLDTYFCMVAHTPSLSHCSLLATHSCSHSLGKYCGEQTLCAPLCHECAGQPSMWWSTINVLVNH